MILARPRASVKIICRRLGNKVSTIDTIRRYRQFSQKVVKEPQRLMRGPTEDTGT